MVGNLNAQLVLFVAWNFEFDDDLLAALVHIRGRSQTCHERQRVSASNRAVCPGAPGRGTDSTSREEPSLPLVSHQRCAVERVRHRRQRVCEHRLTTGPSLHWSGGVTFHYGESGLSRSHLSCRRATLAAWELATEFGGGMYLESCRGRLTVGPQSVQLTSWTGERVPLREISFDAISGLELTSADGSNDRPILVFHLSANGRVEIEGAVGKWILGDLLRETLRRMLVQEPARQRVLVSVKTKPEAREQVAELLKKRSAVRSLRHLHHAARRLRAR